MAGFEMTHWMLYGGIALLVGTLVLIGLMIALLVRKPPAESGISLAQLEELKAERDDWRRRAEAASGDAAEAREAYARIERVPAERDQLRDQLEILQAEKATQARELATLRAEHEAAQRHHAEKLQELDKAREKLVDTFKLTANEVLQRSGEQLTKQGTESLQTLLAPLRDQLKGFQEKVVEDAEKRSNQAGALHQLVQTLHGDAKQMSDDARNLANALRSQSKLQGDWGEMVLASILERAGLREGQEFHTQESSTADDGSRRRPDVIVDMPNRQRLVIDSKVSLTAFERCVNAASDEERASALKQHLGSVRAHIKGLGEKDYAKDYEGVSFTLMFIPLEGAASLALQNDPELAAYAWDREVMIATPTTLMMAMRTVQNLWTVDRQNQNARDIADRAGKLYDKFVGFVKDLDDIGNRLTQAQDSWHGARSKLVEGTGNVVRQAEMLKTLGARTSKSLPGDYLDGAEDEEVPIAAPPSLPAPNG